MPKQVDEQKLDDGARSKNIAVGAYGWQHASWQGGFYPDDLPPDWALSYYSNELDAVMVPADYWQEGAGFDCESWLDDVSAGFSFYVECPEQLLVSATDTAKDAGFDVFLQQMRFLQPALAGVVISGRYSDYIGSVPAVLARLQAIADVATLFSYTDFQDVPCHSIWLSKDSVDSDVHSRGELTFTSLAAPLAVFDDDLRYLRETRLRIQRFATQLSAGGDVTTSSSSAGFPPVIIVRHPVLKAADLIKFRTLLGIMGL